MAALAVRMEKGSAGEPVRLAVYKAYTVKHEIRSIVQLNAEPIPPHLIRSQLIAAELMVHPACRPHLKQITSQTQSAFAL